ncbi:MAG: PAS domain S-box protein [Limnothrix sp. RL_2_0]|nr:PAS domain S-box protein [Limnothrix sp. RL_2_0]
MPHSPPQQLTHTLQSLTPTEMLATIDFLQQELQKSAHQIQQDVAIHHQLQKVEDALRVSEEKFRAIFDSTFQFIGLLDVHGVILEANKTALDAVGVERSQVIGVPFWEAIWWTHSPALQTQLQQGIQRAAAGELVRFEAQHILADGTPVYVDFSLKPIIDQDGKVVLLIPEGRDITDRRAMEIALRETLRSLEFQKLALDEAAIVAVTDCSGVITEVNDQFCQISQYSRAEVIGQTHQLINSGYHSEEFFTQLWETIAAGQVWKGEIKNRAKDGSFYWVDTTIVPFLDEDGQPFQYLAIRFDITAHKIAQDTIHEQAALLDVATDAILLRDLDQKVEFWSHGAEKIYGWSATERSPKMRRIYFMQTKP